MGWASFSPLYEIYDRKGIIGGDANNNRDKIKCHGLSNEGKLADDLEKYGDLLFRFYFIYSLRGFIHCLLAEDETDTCVSFYANKSFFI